MKRSRKKTITGRNSEKTHSSRQSNSGNIRARCPSDLGNIDLVVQKELKCELTQGNQDRSHGCDLSSDPATITRISSDGISCFTVMSTSDNLNCHHDLKVDVLISAFGNLIGLSASNGKIMGSTPLRLRTDFIVLSHFEWKRLPNVEM